MASHPRLYWTCLICASLSTPSLAQTTQNAPPPTEGSTGTEAVAEVEVGAGTRTEATTGTSGGEAEDDASDAGRAGAAEVPDVLAVCGGIQDPVVHRHCVEKTEE